MPHAAGILSNTRASIVYEEKDIISSRNRYGIIELAQFHAAYWVFDEEFKNQMITVVIRRIGNGDKHFYSVFNKKK